MAEMGMASPNAENMISVEMARWLLRGGQEGKIKTSDGGMGEANALKYQHAGKGKRKPYSQLFTGHEGQEEVGEAEELPLRAKNFSSSHSVLP